MYQIDDDKKKGLCVYTGTVRTVDHTMMAKAPISGLIGDAHRSMLTVGHHRAATTGAVNEECTQPFDYWRPDNTGFVGVHNGTLRNWNKEENKIKFPTDSAWAIKKLSEDYDKALKEQIRGAYAFVTYDTAKPDELVIATNGERPMTFCFVKGQNTMFFASEDSMLYWILQRNKIAIEDSAIYVCEPNVKYTFNRKEQLKQYKKDKIVLTYTQPQHQSSNSHSHYNRGSNSLPYFEKKYKDIVARAIAKAKGKFKEAQTDLPLLPAIETAVPIDPAKATQKPRVRLVADEANRLRQIGYKVGATAVFQATIYSEETKALYGSVLLKDDKGEPNVHEAIMRNVQPLTAAGFIEFSTVNDIKVGAIGAFLRERDKDTNGVVHEIVITVSTPEADEIAEIAKGVAALRQKDAALGATVH